MVRPERFHFGAVRDNDQRAIAIDPAQQALDERLCGRVAPVCVLQQEQDGAAVQRRYQERLEDFEGCILALRGVISACDKVSCARNSSNSAMSRRAWRVDRPTRSSMCSTR